MFPRIRENHLVIASIAAGAAILAAVYFFRNSQSAVRASRPKRDDDDAAMSPQTDRSPVLSSDFTLALAYVRSSRGSSLPLSTRLALYGAYKVSEFSRAGRPPRPVFSRPSAFADPSGCSKWDAWTAAATLAVDGTPGGSCDDLAASAESRYVAILDEAAAGWRSAPREKAGSGGVGGAEADAAAMAVGAACASIPVVRALSDADIAALSVDIHVAARDGRTEDVGFLLERAFLAGGASARAALACARSEDGETPLHCAADTGCAGTVRALVEAGAEIDARDPMGQQTPLHYAAAQGRASAVEALVELGADVAARDVDGESAFSLWSSADFRGSVSPEQSARVVALLQR
jgi:hypothetical protein